jgi:penicillin-binding protein 1A
MQKYAEEAVKEHLGEYLQPLFFKEKRGKATAPFSNQLSSQQVNEIMNRYIKQSSRYRDMKAAGCSDAEIKKAFHTPEPMSVFTWHGEKDTIMTPLDSIRYYQYFLHAGFMSMDPITGYVKAYVGGPNYNYFQYDMAMVGRRQVGSTIKPFLYTLAMENGYSPCDVTRNVEQTIIENGRPWTPRNSNRRNYGQIVTLKWGLANSNNWISAYLMSKLNPFSFVRLIHSFGVLNLDIQPTASLCLGPCDISVGEMVSAYTAFADKGIRVAPLFVTRIEDSKGNVISTFTPRMSEVISANSAYKMVVMLREVVNHGTAGRIRRYGITADMGGKTGTSNRNSDGWFIGFTPSLVSGVWVGGDNRDIHFDTMTYGQGASMALPIWVKYMKKVYNDRSLKYNQNEKFQIPDGFDPCGSNAPPSANATQANGEQGIDDLFE